MKVLEWIKSMIEDDGWCPAFEIGTKMSFTDFGHIYGYTGDGFETDPLKIIPVELQKRKIKEVREVLGEDVRYEYQLLLEPKFDNLEDDPEERLIYL